jgi:hypothetical protein
MLAKVALALSMMVGLSAPTWAKGDAAKKPAPTTKKKDAPKKSPPVSAEHKKALAELLAGYKFGMTKDEVVAQLQKQIDAAYEDKIKGTTDVAAQDRIRKEKKQELARVLASFVTFDGKRTGWDVSIVENEFAHHTSESMMERWENQGGKNQRRFFFFYEGKLWKMFVSLDVSILPDDKKNFDTFSAIMEGKYGKGLVDGGTITWTAGDFDVRAIDRLKSYDALGLAIEEPKTRGEVLALREQKKPAQRDVSPVVKSVVDPDHKDHPDVKSNNNAVQDVIKAQDGQPPKK